MENTKMLFFREQADEANVNGIDNQICLPAHRLTSMQPGSTTTIEMLFRSVKNNDLAHNEQLTHDKVVLTVKQGDLQEVLATLVQKINSGPHSDGFIVIADDCTIKDGATGSSPAADTVISAVYAHPSITGVASITVANALYRSRLPSLGIGNAALVAASDGLALSVNTAYKSIVGDMDVTIPSAADGKAGDWITIFYTAAINDGVTHTFTTTTDTAYTLGSLLHVGTGTGSSAIAVVDESVAADNILTITGATNGDGGVGSYVKLVNTKGAAEGWSLFSFVEKQGNGSVASSGTVFS